MFLVGFCAGLVVSERGRNNGQQKWLVVEGSMTMRMQQYHPNSIQTYNGTICSSSSSI
jgi:hypothetical protein